jgi:hypothetical protein
MTRNAALLLFASILAAPSTAGADALDEARVRQIV